MSTLKKLLIGRLNKSLQQAVKVCNYADNYYGDRICTLVDKKQ
ncbi:hypothetical protein [Thalassotalea eurytherma]|uniref:Uncharacterized protein n=1 Tax=Thalassotalea eurytherma TaxID=1144278 RepID=A0ABQ6H3V6_9GAMM|nr:hypothetical protein [Thalassotalea eurytherma]GLX82856.1 hypothetical protein theurythT_23080 [Thalassotalea eurytherma]